MLFVGKGFEGQHFVAVTIVQVGIIGLSELRVHILRNVIEVRLWFIWG
jgi:hypothetical protein